MSEEIKRKDIETKKAEEVKKMKSLERERKRKHMEEEKRRKEERKKGGAIGKKQGIVERQETVEDLLTEMQLSDSSSAESDAVCPKCGSLYSAGGGALWICCDRCGSWFDLKCTNTRSERNIPDIYYCDKCV